MSVVPDAGDDRNFQRWNECGAIRSRPGVEDFPGFQRVRIDPRQAGSATVRDQDVTLVRHDASGFGETAQRRDMPAGVGIDYLKAVPSRVRNENAAGLGFKSPMVK